MTAHIRRIPRLVGALLAAFVGTTCGSPTTTAPSEPMAPEGGSQSEGASGSSSSGSSSGSSTGGGSTSGGSASGSSTSGAGSSSGSGPAIDAGSPADAGEPARATDGGGACPSLTGPADNAYPRWPMPNPPASALPHPFDYTDQGDGTVLDHVTGLVWQKSVQKATQSFTWTAARAYCSGLTLPAPAGSTWHVPTRIQALSLVDYTTLAAMDGPFVGSGQPPSGMYTWTSTPWVVSQIATKPQDAWMVNFGGGGGLTSNAAAQSATEYVRCVASPAVTPLPYPHYVQVGAREVMDVETGLIWSQTSNLSSLSQSAAMSYCATFGLNGHAWRLPSVNELSSLVDDNPDIKRVSPAIDPCVFPDTPANAYYMSSSIVGSTPWALNYEDGFDSNNQSSGYVRCVR
jgi:hypothetical protein